MSAGAGDHRDLLDLASRAADAAVRLVRDRRPADLQVSTKSSSTDLVTEMDRGAEEAIRAVILAERPDDVIMGEELGDGGTGTPEPSDRAVTWWVDPIDGTTNYVYDHPGWNVSIAAAVGGTVVAGVVADPTHGRTYRATLGGGATCDDRPGLLRLADPPPLAHALVATGFGYEPEQRRRQGLVVAAMLPRIRDIRRMGAAALDLCSVASGRVDAFFEAGLSTWDFAAGALIAREAGAKVGGIDGGDVRPGSVLAAHPALYDQMVDLLQESGDATA